MGVVGASLLDLDGRGLRSGTTGRRRRSRRGGRRNRRLRVGRSLGKLGQALLSSGAAASHEVPVASGIVGPDRDAPNVEDDEKNKATDEVVQAVRSVEVQKIVQLSKLTTCSWTHS